MDDKKSSKKKGYKPHEKRSTVKVNEALKLRPTLPDEQPFHAIAQAAPQKRAHTKFLQRETAHPQGESHKFVGTRHKSLQEKGRKPPRFSLKA
jgi:hypothetical protein